MGKRISALLLCLVMVFALLPATVQAAEKTTPVGTMEKLKELLEANGDANITISQDIVKTVKVGYNREYGSGSDYIVLGSGKKTLDLAGHKVELNGDGSGLLTFIRIPERAELVIRDSSPKQSGLLWCDGDMEFWDGSIFLSYFYGSIRCRHVLHVTGGKLTVEGGNIESGRTKYTYVYNGVTVSEYGYETMVGYEINSTIVVHALRRYDANAYEIVGGDAILMNGGEVTINGGKISGRGYTNMTAEYKGDKLDADAVRAAAIVGNSGKLTINAGKIYGMGNANVLSLASDVDFTLVSGHFETQLLSNFIFATPSQMPWDHQLVCEAEDSPYTSRRDPGRGAGRFGIPVDALDKENHTLKYDGNPYYKEDWGKGKITNNPDEKSHALSVYHNKGAAVYTYTPAAKTAETEIASAIVSGTMAQDMTITPQTLTLDSNDKIKSVYTKWYRNGELISGEHEVRFGTYNACVTLYAKKGYKFTENTKFQIMGAAPTQKKIAANGSSAEIWSDTYSFDCTHAYNEDWSKHYDGLSHYQVCSVCGAHLAAEKHIMDSGSDFGPITTYKCTVCDYSCDKENGKTKVNGLVIDFPVAVDGDPIPQPRLEEEYEEVAQLMTWDLRKDSTDEPYHLLKNFEAGETYTLICRSRAKDGCYFASGAKQHCAAVASGTTDGDDGALITTWKIHCYPRASATVMLPDLAGGTTMGEYFEAVGAEIDGTPSGNIQATIKKHGTDNEVYVRKTLAGGWQLVRGADSLASFFASKVEPDTAYDVSFDFSTDNHFIAANAITYRSPASYAGQTVEGGETWFTVSATVVSSGTKVNSIDLDGVMPPETGAAPDVDYTMKTRSLLRPKTGKWDATESFEGEKEYTFTAEVELKDDSKFGSDVVASVNGEKADVKVSGKTATVTYKFPATAPEVKEETEKKTNPFTDVKETDTFYDAVLWAYYHEPQVTNGTAADKFSPDMICTRGQVATFLWRAYGCPEPKTKDNPFTDVKESDWFYKPVLWAVEQGITNGTSATTFTPAQTCTYAHVLTFLYRAAGSPNATNRADRQWYFDALTWANEKGLLADTGLIHCEPTEGCPRKDIVQYLYRQLKNA